MSDSEEATPEQLPVPEQLIERLSDRHFVRMSPGGRVTHAVTVETERVTAGGRVLERTRVVGADGADLTAEDGTPLRWDPSFFTTDRGFSQVEKHTAVEHDKPQRSRILARMTGDKVVEIIRELKEIESEWPEAFLKLCSDVTEADPPVEVNWVKQPDGSFAPPPPYTPTREQQMMAALNEGVTLTCATKALNGIYSVVGSVWSDMRDEALFVAISGKFSAGRTQLDWPVRGGEVVFTSVDAFKAVVQALVDYQTGWKLYVAEKLDEPPTEAVAT